MIKNNEYEEFIKKHNIGRLCYFTKIKNLPFILGEYKKLENGIIAERYVDTNFFEIDNSEKEELQKEYVSTNIQYPDFKTFSSVRKKSKEENADDWAVLLIDPTIIDDSTLFSKEKINKENITQLLHGMDGLNEVTIAAENTISFFSKIPNYKSSEVLIKGKIPLSAIKGIVFESREIVEIEKLRLSLCKINTEDLKFYYSEELFDEDRARKQLEVGEEILFNEL